MRRCRKRLRRWRRIWRDEDVEGGFGLVNWARDSIMDLACGVFFQLTSVCLPQEPVR